MEKKEPDPVVVKLLHHGPVIVQGNIEIIGFDGKPIALTEQQRHIGVTLCRCGRSQKQPFCDGSHLK